MSNNKEEFILGENKFKLPIGYKDDEGVVHKIVQLKPIDGFTEEAMDEPKVKDNGAKVITELLNGIMIKLGSIKLSKNNKEITRELSVMDRDFLLMANAIVSFDKDEELVKFTVKCPSCGNKQELSADLNKVNVKGIEDNAPREFTFKLKDGVYDSDNKCHKSITITIPTGRVQERVYPIATRNRGEATTSTLQMITKKLGELPILSQDTFKGMTTRDRRYANSYLVQEKKLGADFSVSTKCEKCREDFDTDIPIQALMGE